MEQYLMNPATGSVDTLDDWLEVFASVSPDEWGGMEFEDAGLIDVKQNEQGEWEALYV